MGVFSGKFGVVNGRSSVKDWTITETEAQPKAVASNTYGGTIRRRGVGSWTGSYNALGGRPSVFPGQAFSFSGYTAPDNNTEGGTGQLYAGTARVSSLAITWNWASGELISHAVQFAGHLALGKSTGVHSDLTAPQTDETCGTKITYERAFGSGGSSSGLSAMDEWENLVSATLTINSALQAYVNSSTLCWTGQAAGPIDWSISITEQENKNIGRRQRGDDLYLRMYVDSEQYWDVMWAKIREYSGLSVNREGAIIQRTCNLDMNGDLGGNPGSLKHPDGSVMWPA